MSSDNIQLIDASSVCGAEVRGEGVVWEDVIEGRIDQDVMDRVVNAASGGHVCRKCGTVLCSKEHKKEVEKAGFLRGYAKSPGR